MEAFHQSSEWLLTFGAQNAENGILGSVVSSEIPFAW